MKALPIAAALAAVVLTLSACGGSASDKDSQSADGFTPINEGKLTNCTHLSYQPFEYEKGGEIVGFDVDIVAKVAEKLGLEQEVVDTPFETITTGAAFNQKTCDISAAGTTITDERKGKVDFSDSYFDANQAVLVKDKKPASEADLKGMKIAVQQGTTGEMYANENIKDATNTTYEDLPLSRDALKNGQHAAVINDNGVHYDYAKQNSGFNVAFDIATGEHYGIAVKKGNAELLKTTNEVLAQLKSDGTYNEIYKKWFGVDAPTAGASAAATDK